MVEHPLDVGRVTGSNPVSRTMIILGIETSCDETALCLFETRKDGGVFQYRILGNIVHSQIELHKEYGGVYPTLAKREHIKNLPILFEQIKKETGIENENIDAIAVTEGPGLEPALWTGISFAGELGKLHKKPIYPINHMEGHVVSVFLNDSKPHEDFRDLLDIKYPALAVLLSGGHTEIVSVEGFGKYKILGRTKDDAVGEAFDKVARMLGLPYPGGPQISLLAKEAREKNTPQIMSFPRPMIHSKDLDFSFSGLKTSVLYSLKKIENMTDDVKKDVSREFENAVTEVVVAKTRRAAEENEYKSLILAGGVAANTHIKEAFGKLSQEFSMPLYIPVSGLSGDNALMIALAGALHTEEGIQKAKDPENLVARGNLSLEN